MDAGREVKRVSLDGPLTVVAGPNPPTPGGLRSTLVQVLHWRLDDEFSDPQPHFHAESDELYIVLEGSILVTASGTPHHVDGGEALSVPAGVVHQLVAVTPPARGLTIRGPAKADKYIVDADAP